jgi:putative hydrolase
VLRTVNDTRPTPERGGYGWPVADRRDPTADLRQIALLMERAGQPTFKIRAFRAAAATLDDLTAEQIDDHVAAGTLRTLTGIGKSIAQVVADSVRGAVPARLAKLETTEPAPLGHAAAAIRAALRGDCHAHSDWSDGGSPIGEMADAARALGHDYLVLTDHSPRLTVANGLSAERLEKQLAVISECNEALSPFRILTGIEVDIDEDGTLDQQPALLERLDLVVASVHSKLRMPVDQMTPRMVAAVANGHTDVLGHCTGRLVTGGRGGRPPSQFDPELVFAACEAFGVAVEINSRPERMDPPDELLCLAVEAGCLFSIDTDAHAPGQLAWQRNGCEKAVEAGVPLERIVNTWAMEDLLAWTAEHEHRP